MVFGDHLKGERVNSAATTQRRVFARLSITAGNAVQISAILAAYFALRESQSAHSPATAISAMFLAWVLLYFSCHAIAHWLVRRVVGIRFLHYPVCRTSNPRVRPTRLWRIFQALPLFRVSTQQALY